ncbi:maleylpyruvate isomerase N-terminal domain-containing protein [Micromonospora sp. NPDC049645]|uniref:maleylpyruvate isomerase N-terminal domain-containing protein n=1 Tax=Micromonospora sp. NPDC049645 TaxID=3155508 RepID=UPI00343B904E
MDVSSRQWEAIRRDVATAGERFAALVEAAAADRRATKHWSVADTAAHVATLTDVDVVITRAYPEPAFSLPEVHEQWRRTTVDRVDLLNDAVMRSFPERNPGTLAARIRADCAAMLDATRSVDPSSPLPWLGSSTLTMAGLFAHIVNEFHIHGRDIARAAGLPHAIPPAEAAPFFEVFFVGLVRDGYGHLLDTPKPLPDVRVTVAFESRHTRPVALLLADNVVRVAEPGTRPDARVTYDPVVFNLMLFGRVSPVRAALTGGIRVGGPRPWLLPAFMRKVRCPK